MKLKERHFQIIFEALNDATQKVKDCHIKDCDLKRKILEDIEDTKKAVEQLKTK